MFTKIFDTIDLIIMAAPIAFAVLPFMQTSMTAQIIIAAIVVWFFIHVFVFMGALFLHFNKNISIENMSNGMDFIGWGVCSLVASQVFPFVIAVFVGFIFWSRMFGYWVVKNSLDASE